MSEAQMLSGKTALVTGATGGIGLEIARGLLERGVQLVIGARDPARGEAVRARLAEETGNANVEVMPLDVAELSSVATFASEFARRHPTLHLLVNNAGAWFSERHESREGIELTLATNVLGPFYLTALLEGPLAAAARARVVNVVSGLAANYDPEDLLFTRRRFDGFKAYAQSKQALRMITWGQAARLESRGIAVNAAAPGFVRTRFNRNAHGFTASMIGIMVRLFGVGPAEGARTPLWVATAPELERVTGRYFDGLKEKDGKFRDPAAIADLERRLQELVERRGLSFPRPLALAS